MFTRLLGVVTASVALTLNASAGIQAVSITGGSFVEGTSATSGTATLGGGTGTLSGLLGVTISTRREATPSSLPGVIYMTGDNTPANTLSILVEDYFTPPADVKSLASGYTVDSSSEDVGTGSSDTIFSASAEAVVYDPGTSFGEFKTPGAIGYFGLRYYNGLNNFFGYGSIIAVDTATAGTGLTFGNTVYFEDQADTGIQIGSTPPSTGGDVPEPTGFAILGLIALGAGLKRSRRS